MSQDDIKRLHNLNQADLDEMMTSAAQRHARAYKHEHRVLNRQVYQNTLYAQVRGSEAQPYKVEISVEDGKVYGYCTCPYDWGGWCKHIGAVIMDWIDNPAQFKTLDERPESVFQEYDEEQDIWDQEWDEEKDKEETPPSQHEQLSSLETRPSADDFFVQEIKQLLQNNTVEQLREMAQNLQINVIATRKDEIIDALSQPLANPTQVQARLGRLDDTGLRILIFTHLSIPPGYGGVLGNLRPFGIQGLSNQVIQKHIEQILNQGLLIPFKKKGILYLTLPQIVRAYLPPLPNAIAAWPKNKLSQTELKYRDFTSLAPKLYRMWTFLQEKRAHRAPHPPVDIIEKQWEHLIGWRHDPDEVVQMRKGGHYFPTAHLTMSVPPAPAYLDPNVRQALCELLNAENEEIEFYYALLEQTGTVSGAPGQPIQTDLARIQALLSQNINNQLAMLATAWQRLDEWSEMDLVLRNTPEIGVRRNTSYAGFKLDDLYQEWRNGRSAMMRFISLLTENEWVSIEAFLHIVYEILPNIFHMNSDPNVWWIESTRKKKQFGAGFEDWLIGYGRPVMATLTGPLNWLGLVELAYQQNQPVAMRLTPVGALLLRRRTSISSAERPTYKPDQIVRFKDNLTVEVISGVAHPDLYLLLSRIGRLENATAQILTYRLDAEGVRHAFEQGETAANLNNRLAQLIGKPAPEAWQQRLREWEANYGHLHLYQDITLIELADDLALHELLAATSLRNHLIYRFSNRLIAIRSDAVDELAQEMEKRGYMPRVTG